MKPIEKAVSVRRLQGEEAEYFLYKYINKYPGISAYELSKRLGWSYGKIRKALDRLGDLVYYEEEKTKYPYKKLVYATNWYDIPDGEAEKSDTRNIAEKIPIPAPV